MKCLNCGNEMEQGTVEGYAQGGDSSYEFISNGERQKKGIKGFLPEILLLFSHILLNTRHGIAHSAKK